MNEKIHRGQAVILVGPSRQQRTALALAMAQRHGTMFECDADQLFAQWRFEGIMLNYRPRTIIVNGIPVTPDQVEMTKRVLSSQHIEVRSKGELTSREMYAPNFIFSTGSIDFLKIDPADRRFRVVEV